MKKHPTVITAKWLEQNNACDLQLERFREVFPKGTRITLPAIKKAVSADIDAGFIAYFLFNSKERKDWWKIRWELDDQIHSLTVQYPAHTTWDYIIRAHAFWQIYSAARKKQQAKAKAKASGR